MPQHDELIRALIAQRIGQGRLPENFADRLPQRNLPTSFGGGGLPASQGLFGVPAQQGQTSLGNFSQPFRPLRNPPPAQPSPNPLRARQGRLNRSDILARVLSQLGDQRGLGRLNRNDRGGDRGGFGGGLGTSSSGFSGTVSV